MTQFILKICTKNIENHNTDSETKKLKDMLIYIILMLLLTPSLKHLLLSDFGFVSDETFGYVVTNFATENNITIIIMTNFLNVLS